MSSETYYTILGVNKKSQLSEIKKAYRTKAKLFHPDLNPSPDSHDKFIEINEAYEYLMNINAGKVYNGHSFKSSPLTPEEKRQEWVRGEQEKARRRASYYADLKYSDFKKSELYKTSEFLSSFSDYLFIALGILAPIGAISGLLTNGIFYFQNGEKKLDILALVTAFMIILFGTAIIGFFIKFKKKN